MFKPGDKVTPIHNNNWVKEGLLRKTKALGPKKGEVVTVIQVARDILGQPGIVITGYEREGQYAADCFRKVIDHTSSVSAKDLLKQPIKETIDSPKVPQTA